MHTGRGVFALAVTCSFLLTGCVAPVQLGPPLLGAGDQSVELAPNLDLRAALPVFEAVEFTVNLAAWTGELLTLPAAGAGLAAVAPEALGEAGRLQILTLSKPLGWEEVNLDYPVMRYGDEIVVTAFDGRRLARLEGQGAPVALPLAGAGDDLRLVLGELELSTPSIAAASDRWIVESPWNLTGSLVVPSEPLLLRSLLDDTYLTVGTAGTLLADTHRSFNAFWLPTPPAVPPVRVDHAGEGAAPAPASGEGLPKVPEAAIDLKSWFGTYLRPSSDPLKPVDVEQGTAPTEGARWTLARTEGTGRFRFGDVVTLRYRPLTERSEGLVLTGDADGTLKIVPPEAAGTAGLWVLENPLDRFSRDPVRATDAVNFRNVDTSLYVNAESDGTRVSARAEAPYEYETWRLVLPVEEDVPAGDAVRGGSTIRLLTAYGRFLAVGLAENASLATVGDASPIATDFRVWRVAGPTFTGPVRYGDRVLLSRGPASFLNLDPATRTVGIGLSKWADAMWTLVHPTDSTTSGPLVPGSPVVLVGSTGLDVFAARRNGRNFFEVGGFPTRAAGGSEILTVGLVKDGEAKGVPDASLALRARGDVVIATGSGYLAAQDRFGTVSHVPVASGDPTSRFFVRLRDEPLDGGALWLGDRITLQDSWGRYLTMQGGSVSLAETDEGVASTFVVEGVEGPAYGDRPALPGVGFTLRSIDRTHALTISESGEVEGTAKLSGLRWSFEVPSSPEPTPGGPVHFGDGVRLKNTKNDLYLQALDRAAEYGVRADGGGESPWSTFVFVDAFGTTRSTPIATDDVIFVRTMHGRFLESALCGTTLGGCVTSEGHRRAAVPSPGRIPSLASENGAVRFRIEAVDALIAYGERVKILDDSGVGDQRDVGTFVLEPPPPSARGAPLIPGSRVVLDREWGALVVTGNTVGHAPGKSEAWTLRPALNVDPTAPLRYGDRVDLVNDHGARLIGGHEIGATYDTATIPDGWKIFDRDGRGSGVVRDGDTVQLRYVDGVTVITQLRALDAPTPVNAIRYGDLVRAVSDNGYSLVATDTFQSFKVRAEGVGTHSWEGWTVEPLAGQAARDPVRYREPLALKSRHGRYLAAAGVDVDAAKTAAFAWTIVRPEDPLDTSMVRHGDRFLIVAGPVTHAHTDALRATWDASGTSLRGHVDYGPVGDSFALSGWRWLPPSGLESNAEPVQLGNVVMIEHHLGKNLSRAVGGEVGLVDGKGPLQQWVPILASNPGNYARLFYEDEIGITGEGTGRWLGASDQDLSVPRWDVSSGIEGRRRWVVENPWGTLPLPVESGGEARFRIVEPGLDKEGWYLHEAVRIQSAPAVQTRWNVIDTKVRGTLPLVNGDVVLLANDHEGRYLGPARSFAATAATASPVSILLAKAPSSLLFIEFGERIHLRRPGTTDEYLSSDATFRKGTPRAEETWLVMDPIGAAGGSALWPGGRIALKNLGTGGHLATGGSKVIANHHEAGLGSTWFALRPQAPNLPELDRAKATASTSRLALPAPMSPSQPLVATSGGGDRPWFLSVPECATETCPPARLVPYDPAPHERGAAQAYKVDLPPPKAPFLPAPGAGGSFAVHTTPEAILPVKHVDCRGVLGSGAGAWPQERCKDFVLLLSPSTGRFMLNGAARAGTGGDVLASFTQAEGALLPYRPGIRIEPLSAVLDWIYYFSGLRAEPPSLVSTLQTVYRLQHDLWDVSPSLDLQSTQGGYDAAVPLEGLGAYLAYNRATGSADIVQLDRVTIYESLIFLGSFDRLVTGFIPWWSAGGLSVAKAGAFWAAGKAFKELLLLRAWDKLNAGIGSNVLKSAMNFVPIGTHWAVDGIAYGPPLDRGYSVAPSAPVNLGKGWTHLVPYEARGNQFLLAAAPSQNRFVLETMGLASAAPRELAVAGGAQWAGYQGLSVFLDRDGDAYLLGANGQKARIASLDVEKGELRTLVEVSLATSSKVIGLTSWTYGVGYLAEMEGSSTVAIHAVALATT